MYPTKRLFLLFVENPETCVAARKLRKKNVTVRLKTSGAELSWESLQIKKDKNDNHDADLIKASGHNHSWESLQRKIIIFSSLLWWMNYSYPDFISIRITMDQLVCLKKSPQDCQDYPPAWFARTETRWSSWFLS